MRFKLLFLYFVLCNGIILSSCQQKYKYALTKQVTNLSLVDTKNLQEKGIIIIGDPLFVGTMTIDGVVLSDVIISDKIIDNAEERYIISHLIRNILIENIIIYDNEWPTYALVPIFSVNNAFIYKNRKDICRAIYYLLHKDFFNLYANQASCGDKFFTTTLLAVIRDDIKDLECQLIKENGILLEEDESERITD